MSANCAKAERCCLVGNTVWDGHRPLWRLCKLDERGVSFRCCKSQTILQWISVPQSAFVASTESWVCFCVLFCFFGLFSFKLILSSTSVDLAFPVSAFTAFYNWTLNVSNVACNVTTPPHRVAVLLPPFPKNQQKQLHILLFSSISTVRALLLQKAAFFFICRQQKCSASLIMSGRSYIFTAALDLIETMLDRSTDLQVPSGGAA